MFKYVSKMASGDCDQDTELDLPSWVVGYFKILPDERKTAGIRFWQTGGGFYTMVKEAKPAEKKEPMSSRIPYTIRQRWEIWKSKASAQSSAWHIINGMYPWIRYI